MSSTNIDLVRHDDLQSVANAIKTKAGASGAMTFPAGFISTINSIASGGYTLPTLTNAASATDVLYGKQYIDGNGSQQSGEMVNDTSTSGNTSLTPSSNTKEYAGSKYYANSHGATVASQDVSVFTLNNNTFNVPLGFCYNNLTDMSGNPNQTMSHFIRKFTVSELGGDIVRVHKGVIGPITDGTSLTIPSIPFSTMLGFVVFQYDRGTYKNGNVMLTYAKSTTEFGDDSDVYYGGSYGSTSPGSSDPVARNLTGNYASFSANSVTIEFPTSGDNRHLVRGSYAYIVWGR